jgi:SRSO17 transposase
MEIGINDLENQLLERWKKFSSYFARSKAWEVGFNYIKGLLCKVERKNSWQIAQTVGSVNPYCFQNMLNRGSFDADSARDANQQLLISELGEGGIFVADETGFLKKGTKSAGVKRQYSGTAGRIENSQVGVFAGYRTEKGHALIDRELYIPSDWIEDKDRCKEAGIEENAKFYTKPQLASKCYNRFIKNGHRASWVAADEAYGRDPEFKINLEKHSQAYVLAVPKDTVMRVGLLKFKAEDWQKRVGKLEWNRASCGYGTKGERIYDWALIKRSEKCEEGFARFLLIRQSRRDIKSVAFYTVFCPVDKSLEEIINVAGNRWSIEECFEMAKGETGLDQYEVRTKIGWYRHITLAMIALTMLVITKAQLMPATIEDSLEEFKKKRKKQ